MTDANDTPTAGATDYPKFPEMVRRFGGDATKHKSEALQSLDALHEYESEIGSTDETLLMVAIEAQVHATLYLAEQQRVTNLIAFQALTGEKYLRETRAALGLNS